MAKRRNKRKTKSRKHSRLRFRVTLVLLSLASLALFLVAAFLIYHTLRFTSLIEQRLQGEQLSGPTWVEARPFELRTGQRLSRDELIDVLNALGYRRTGPEDRDPGSFGESEGEVILRRRGRLALPVAVSFEDKWVAQLRELRGESRLERVELESVPVTPLFGQDRAKRRWVPLDEIPTHLVAAVLATEDRRFFEHTGFDPIGIARALARDLRSGELQQGGSTITQQLVKNYFLTPERTVTRKLLEAYLAVLLETRTSKESILELYLNNVYLGQRGSFGIHGAGQAAQTFFGKDARNLTLSESALIAAIIRSPNQSSPFDDAGVAKSRRDLVLGQMVEAGYLQPDAATSAQATPLGVKRGTVDSGEAPFFIDALRQELLDQFDSGKLLAGELRIESTMDRYLQTAAQSAVVEGMEEIRKNLGEKAGEVPQAALVAMNPRNGDILALVGSRSYGESQFNRAVSARRQPGSAFKPFVYLAAFEKTERVLKSGGGERFSPASRVVDEPTTFRQGGRRWTPQNYSRRFEGQVSFRRALALSLNVATAKVGERVGFEKVVELWESMGMSSRLEPYPSLVLGSFEVTPLELATAYAVLANGGRRVEPRFFTAIRDGEGDLLLAPPIRSRAVVSPGASFLVTDMLKSVLSSGTAREIRARGFTAAAAGKTGTTNDTRDAWFVGYTPDVLAAVWVGYDDNAPLGLSGSQAALPIWTRFMKAAVSGREKHEFQPPSGVVFTEIDPASGEVAKTSCPRREREVFLRDTQPRRLCRLH